MKSTLQANAAVITLVGIFEETRTSNLAQRFRAKGYEREPVSDTSKAFFKDTFYPEFRDLMFLGQKPCSASVLQRSDHSEINFLKSANKQVAGRISKAELFLFASGLHFFCIQLSPAQLELNQLSDLMFCLRNFYTPVVAGGKEQQWVHWIEENLLDGIRISSTNEERIEVDEYSGSKFKLFSVIDIPEKDWQNNALKNEHLLYDLATVSPIGTAGSSSYLSPSKAYYDVLMNDKISAFQNYYILPLFDTFTTLGSGIIWSEDPDRQRNQQMTWTQTYFRIYLFNLFIKYNLFRYNHAMEKESVKARDEFESFLNTYNLSHISYNFLPNLLFHRHRKSLQIDDELQKFQVRINRISQAIQEEEQKRSNRLLGLVGAMTSIAGLQPVLEYLELGRKALAFSYLTFYPLLLLVLALAAIPVVNYLYPKKVKQLLQQWKGQKH